MAQIKTVPAPKPKPTLAELRAAAQATADGVVYEPGATHVVVRHFDGEKPYKPGDRVNAEGWRHTAKLERLRYITPIDPVARARVEGLPPVPEAPAAQEPGLLVIPQGGPEMPVKKED